MNLSVGTKLICTYLAVVALMIAPVAGIGCYLRFVRQSQAQVLTVAQPTVSAAKEVREGLHQAAAGLRGYIAVGGEHFRQQRQQGQQIAQQGLQTLDGLTQNASPAERQLLEQIRRELGDIQTIHQAMETAPRQTSELPAFQKLAGDSTPLGEQMLAACNAMIDIESKLEKTPRRTKLLEEMTTLRAALHGSLVEMHSYLTTAQEQHVKNFGDQWQALGAALTTLAAERRLLTTEQDRQFGQVQQLVSQFRPLPDRLFAMRKSESWNVAQRQVKDEAAPREAHAEALLAQVIGESENRSQRAQQTLQAQSAWLGTLAVGGPGLAAVIGIFIGFSATRRVARRLQQTMKAMEALAVGDITTRLPAETSDEFGRMATAINHLAEATAERNRVAAQQAQSVPEITAAEIKLPEINTERLRTFVDAEVGRRRPFSRPQAVPTFRQEAAVPASRSAVNEETDARAERTMHSFQTTLGQIMATAGNLAASTRHVAANMPQGAGENVSAPAWAPASPASPAAASPSAAITESAAETQLRDAVSRQTESLAQSSERLRAQAAQLDQLMRQLQQGLAETSEAEQPLEAAQTALSNVHGAESPLTGPKMPVKIGQSLLTS